MDNAHLYHPEYDGEIVFKVRMFDDVIRVLKRTKEQLIHDAYDDLTGNWFWNELGNNVSHCYQVQTTFIGDEFSKKIGEKTFNDTYFVLTTEGIHQVATEKEMILELLNAVDDDITVYINF